MKQRKRVRKEAQTWKQLALIMLTPFAVESCSTQHRLEWAHISEIRNEGGFAYPTQQNIACSKGCQLRSWIASISPFEFQKSSACQWATQEKRKKHARLGTDSDLGSIRAWGFHGHRLLQGIPGLVQELQTLLDERSTRCLLVGCFLV